MFLNKFTINNFKTIKYPDFKVVRSINFFLSQKARKEETTSEAVHFLKQILLDDEPWRSTKILQAASSHNEENPINFKLELSFSKLSSSPFLKAVPEIKDIFQSIKHIELMIEIGLNTSTNVPNITLFDFIVNHKPFFRIRNRPSTWECSGFRKRIYVFGHDMIPDELKDEWETDHYLETMENDCCETHFYEGYDTDLSEDWSNSFDDFESDAFLDNGRDEAYAPAFSDPEIPELSDEIDEDAQSCWKYYDIIQKTLLPPSLQHLKTIKEMDEKCNDRPKDIFSASYKESSQDDIFFHNVIMQIFSGTFEILKMEFQNPSC